MPNVVFWGPEYPQEAPLPGPVARAVDWFPLGRYLGRHPKDRTGYSGAVLLSSASTGMFGLNPGNVSLCKNIEVF